MLIGAKASYVLYGLACIHTSAYAAALPTDVVENRSPAAAAKAADGIPLRIMPLGASITNGIASSKGNGYRKYLRQQLVSAGNTVNMVGSNHTAGTMKDKDNSGYPGYVITQVHTVSNTDTPAYRPNLVLINAGTNDAVQNVSIASAGERMRGLVADILAQSPRASIVLSAVLVNADDAVQARAVRINTQYAALVDELRGAGRPIVWADMQGLDGPLRSDLVSDGIHPNDTGYVKMAKIWLAAIEKVRTDGFLQTAEPVEGIPDDGDA